MNILPKNPVKVLLTIAYIALAFLFLAYVAPKIITYFLPFMIAWLMSAIIRPVVNFLERLHIHRRLSVIVSMLFVMGILSAAVYYLSVSLIDELQSIVKLIQKTAEDGMPVFVKDLINLLPGSLKNFAMEIAERTEGDIVDFIYPAAKSALSGIGGAAVKLPSALVFAIVLILATYFISYDGVRIKSEIKKLVPEARIEHMNLVKQKLSDACGGYIKAQLILMLIVFCILFTGFLILRVDFALLLALVISIWDAIPFFGTGIILNPWALINLVQGKYFEAAGFFILYLIILLTRQFLEPRILSGQLGLHPLFTLMAIYIGLKSMGIIGMILGPIILIIVINCLKIHTELEGDDICAGK